MNFKSPKLYIMMAITFAIVFAMNYFSNAAAPDRVERALLTAFAGAIGLGVGMWIFNKNKDGAPPPDFD